MGITEVEEAGKAAGGRPGQMMVVRSGMTNQPHARKHLERCGWQSDREPSYYRHTAVCPVLCLSEGLPGLSVVINHLTLTENLSQAESGRHCLAGVMGE